MKTRKILGIILAIAVLLCGVVVTGFQAAADSSVVTGSWRSVEYGFFNLSYGSNGVITTGSTISDTLNKMFYEFDSEVDLYDVESVNFYFKNDTGLPLAFWEIGVKAAVTTNDNAAIIDNNVDFWNGHPGCLWVLTHDCANYPVQVKATGSDEWVNADTTAYGGTGSSVLTIPAGFDGEVKIPLSPDERAYGDGSHRISRGLALNLGVGYKDGNSPSKDDYANKTFTINNISYVKPEKTNDVSWRSVEYAFYGLNYAADGTITFGANSQNVNLEKMFGEFAEAQDLYNAEDMHFHFTNNTGLPITFYNASAKAAVTTNDNAAIIDSDIEFWNDHPGCLWNLNHDFAAYPFYVKADGESEWTLADTTNYGGQPAVLTIPAGFSGDVKLPLSDGERMYGDGSHRYSNGIALFMSTGTSDGEIKPSSYNGKTMVITGIGFTEKAAEPTPEEPTPEPDFNANTTATIINDSSTTPVISVRAGGLNLCSVQETTVENGMTKVKVNGFNGNDPVSQMWITPPAEYSDFSDVIALQMYVKNTSSEPFGWTWVRACDDTNCESSVMYIQDGDQWVKALSIPSEGVYDYVDANGQTWRKVWRNTLVVPGNYDGLIRIVMNTEHFKNNAPQLLNPFNAMALSIVVPNDNKATIWFDDLAIVKASAGEPALNGFVTGEDGELRYYDNDEAQYAGVMAYDGGYVYFNSTCTAVRNKTNYYVTKTNDLVEIGYYDFDANGKMTASVGEAIGDSLYADPDGEIRFYDGAEAAYQGVVTDNDGNFYYVNSMKKAVKDREGYVITKTNGLLPAGAYNIGADGKIAVNYIDAAGKLIKQADGEVIYFDGGEAQYAGVVQAADGSYYYVNSTKKAVRSQTYFITKTNGLIEAGLYDIGADGVIAIS